MQMTPDQLEYAISQYLDGTLAPLESAALEERLAGDADARELFGEYQRLDGVVKNALPEPEVDWSAFSAQLNNRMSDAEAPVKHYRFSFGRIGWAAAVAASLLIIVGIAALMLRNRPGGVTPAHPTGGGELIVQGPSVEPSTGPAVAEVTIGAPQNTDAADAGWQSYEALISRPSRVVIGGADNSAQDSDAAPY
jgi:anti-sigma factor RsiW